MNGESVNQFLRTAGSEAQLHTARKQVSEKERTVSVLQVRAARLDDCGAIADIYNEAIRSGCSTMDTKFAKATDFARYVNDPVREVILVAELARQTVGWGIVKRYSDRPGYRYACEISVYIADAYQHQGCGSRLFEAVIAAAYSLGYRHLVAKILAVNETSIRVTQGFGFEIVGRQRAIGYLNGRWHDVVILQRVLDTTQP